VGPRAVQQLQAGAQAAVLQLQQLLVGAQAAAWQQRQLHVGRRAAVRQLQQLQAGGQAAVLQLRDRVGHHTYIHTCYTCSYETSERDQASRSPISRGETADNHNKTEREADACEGENQPQNPQRTA
jgi:hypothetical protein